MKNVIAEHVEVWAASMKDEPGGLAKVLSGLRDAGADLELIIARRSPEEPGTGVVFVAPLRGDDEVSTAAMLGFNITSSVQSVRVQGDNEPGVAAVLTEKLAAAGINLRGLTAAVMGTKFIMYIGLDSSADAARVIEILQQE
ncbi:MAG TPA: ACT domain-containing protein [Candidatus Anammoximicrobium sp.]|nr:ACT domain-containing protein [Candidatus Anammoximicrobium sp.]